MKTKPATWITLEASQALNEMMATLQEGILQVAEGQQQRKSSNACIELPDIIQAMPLACQLWLEVIDQQGRGVSRGQNKVA